MVHHKNLLIMGDLNIHLNNHEDNEAMQFIDSVTALGLTHKVKYGTHIKGNLLDHIYVESNLNFILENINVGELISDHHWITANISIPKSELIKVKKVRDLSKIDCDQFFKDSNFDEFVDIWLEEDANPNELIPLYSSKLQNSLEKHALTKLVKMRVKERKIRYNDGLVVEKKRLRKRAIIWMKYGENHQLEAFKQRQKIYNRLLRKAKNDYVTKEINEKIAKN